MLGLAGDKGIEPLLSVLEADALPLHQSPLARPEGFEPSTIRVEAGCSDPLSYGRLARQVGFEPTTSGSEARRTDPLCYWRVLEAGAGVEPTSTGYEPVVEPFYYPAIDLRQRLNLVCVVGIEPTTSCSQGRRATAALHAEVVGRGSEIIERIMT